MREKLTIFCCYARKDQPHLVSLRTHLRALEREGFIHVWHDSDIDPGTDWKKAINEHLERADIFLFLVSPDSLASDYCYSWEMKRAIERHEQGEVHILPLILRPCNWEHTPFAQLQALPTNRVPVIDPRWHSVDEAFDDAMKGIRRVVIPLLVKHDMALGEAEYTQHHYREAFLVYDHILNVLDPHCADAYLGKGKALAALGKSTEALVAYNYAIYLKRDNASYYEEKSQALMHSHRYEDALEALDQAIRLESKSARLHIKRGKLLQHLHKYEGALEAYHTAFDLDSQRDPQVYHDIGDIHEHLAHQAHSLARQHGYVAKDQKGLQSLSASLEKLSSEMVGVLEMPVLVKNIVEAITRALGAAASSLYLIEPGTRILRIQAATGYHSPLVDRGASYDLEHKRGVTAWIAREGRKFMAHSVDELHRHPEWQGKYKMDQGGREPNAFLGIPLKFLAASGEEETIGVLKIEDIRDPAHREPYFTEQDSLLAEAMARVIPFVIQSARLNDYRLHELNSSLRTLSEAMVGGLDMDVLVKNSVETIAKVVGADASSLFLTDTGKPQRLLVRAATGYQRVLVAEKATYHLHDKGITAFIARTRERVTARSKEELRQHPAWAGKYTTAQGGHEPNAFLGIPLRVLVAGGGEEIIGVLKVEDIRSNPRHPETYFTEQDITLVEMMGNLITTVIQNTRLNVIHLHELNDGLKKLLGAMEGRSDMSVQVKKIVQTIREVLRAEAASLYLIEPGTRILRIQAAVGYHRPLGALGANYDLDHEKGVTAWIAREGERFVAHSVDELHRHPEWQGKYKMDQGGREPNAFLGIPLRVLVDGGDEETIGVLKIEDIHPDPRHPETYFTEQDIILAQMMGSVIATVMQNRRSTM